jgi:CO/xanthine dehydrogenase Mo-binding subunit
MKPGARRPTPGHRVRRRRRPVNDHDRRTPPPAAPEVGKARVRKEDAPPDHRPTRFTDAITPQGTLHTYVVRSPLAHATITGVDTAAAKAAPGVVGVYTAADLGVESVGCPAPGRSPRT